MDNDIAIILVIGLSLLVIGLSLFLFAIVVELEKIREILERGVEK